jgi:hypothetical protein
VLELANALVCFPRGGLPLRCLFSVRFINVRCTVGVIDVIYPQPIGMVCRIGIRSARKSRYCIVASQKHHHDVTGIG